MIAFVEGVVAYVESDQVVVDVNGVGYQVFVSGTTAFQIRVGERMRLFTHYHVREDAHLLFGFKTREERELFIRLNNVSGIGPKVALAILGAGTPDQVVFAIRMEDLNFLVKLPGVGKKTAQRLVLDLKDKLDDLAMNMPTAPFTEKVKPAPKPSGVGTELFEALVALGYNEKEAQGAVRGLVDEIGQGMSIEALIKLALKQLLRQ